MFLGGMKCWKEEMEDEHPNLPLTVKTYQNVENMGTVVQNDCLSIRKVAE
jgi:hypothetical protein